MSTKSSRYLSYDIFSSTLLSETDLMDWLKIKWERGSGFFNIDKKFFNEYSFMYVSGSISDGSEINCKYLLADIKDSAIIATLYEALTPELSPSNIIVGLLEYFQARWSCSSVNAVPNGATTLYIPFWFKEMISI